MANLPQISWVAREFVKGRLLDNGPLYNGFNSNIQAACDLYGYEEDLTLSVSNLLLGRIAITNVIRSTSPNPYPFAVLSIMKSDAMSKLAMKVTPSTFSGAVVLSLDFNIIYRNGKVPVDGESGFFALETAIASCLNSQETYTLMPMGLTYDNELLSEQGPLEWDGTKWTQLNAFAAVFYRVT